MRKKKWIALLMALTLTMSMGLPGFSASAESDTDTVTEDTEECPDAEESEEAEEAAEAEEVSEEEAAEAEEVSEEEAAEAEEVSEEEAAEDEEEVEAVSAAAESVSLAAETEWAPADLVVNIGATEDSISIVWYDTTETAGVLTFGGTDYIAETEASSRDGYTINRVTIDGLTASTDYTYYITSGDGSVSEEYSYTTQAFGDGESFSFAIVGDPQIGASGSTDSDTEGWTAAVDAILDSGTALSFLFSMGDQVNAYYAADGSNGESVEVEYDGYLLPTGLSSIAMATVLGNHDAGNDNSTLYSEHFLMPNVSDYGENQEGDGDYYFTYNGVLFMVLNSSNLSIAEHQAFLEETLEANPDATWTVVSFHKSIYSVASHVTESDIETLRTGLSPIFTELGIDLVIQGHDHVYARSYIMGGETGMEAEVTDEVESDIFDADGVLYITFNSASGSKYYNITSEAFTYTAVQNQEKVANYSIATVDEESFTITTYRVTDDSVVDTVTLHKSSEEEEEEEAWEPTDLVVNIGATEDSISIVWYDTTETAGVLTFGGTDYTAETEASSRDGYTINRVTIDGLTASTDYNYYITSGDGSVSEEYSYTTQTFGDGETFSFAIVGDPQIGASGSTDSDTEGWTAAVDAILDNGTALSFLFSMGDQVNAYYEADGSNGESVEVEYDGYLLPTGLSSIAMATVLGNHDAGNDNSTLYSEHFLMPNVSDYGENQEGDGDYYFTYNGVLFMVLNSSNLSIAEHQAFLEETLAANPDATWTVVSFHKSIYSVAKHVTESDIETLRNGLSPIFTELDIDLVIQGHDHVYARSYVMGGETGMEAEVTDEVESEIYDADGVVYVTFNSASGSKYYSITSEAFTYTAVQNQEKVANYSIATVTEDSFTVTTYRVTDDSVVDTFTLYKTSETDTENSTEESTEETTTEASTEESTDAADESTTAADESTDAADESTSAADESTTATEESASAADEGTEGSTADAGLTDNTETTTSTETTTAATTTTATTTTATETTTAATTTTASSTTTTASSSDSSSSVSTGDTSWTVLWVCLFAVAAGAAATAVVIRKKAK